MSNDKIKQFLTAVDSGKVSNQLKPLDNQALDTLGIPQFSMGVPSNAQMAKINALLNKDSDPQSWYTVTFHASDNLVSRSIRKWHQDILSQMEASYPGCELLINHDSYDVESSVGFIYDSNLITTSTCPDSVWMQSGKEDSNKSIIDKEGFSCLYLTAAISSDMTSIIQGIQSRRLQNCSTGGLLSEITPICPNCSDELGREVSFLEQDTDGEYVCPHDPPSQWNTLYAMSPAARRWVADYVELNGLFDPIEHSMVQAGNLPAASIVR